MKPEPLEVIVLNDHASINGGAAAVAIASALELARRGIDVTYFACVGPVAEELQGVRNLRVVCLDQPEIAHDPNRPRAFIRGIRNGRAAGELRRLLADKSPERTIVHAHSWSKALSPFALAVPPSLEISLVVTLHDFFITCPNGGFFDYTANTICGRRPLSASCWTCNCDRRSYAQKLWRGARTLVQNRILGLPAHVAHFIGVSRFSLDRMRSYLPSNVPATVVRNPISVSRESPVSVANHREFVYVGRLEREKGAELFAQAVNSAGVAAKFIGDGSLREELQRSCPQARFTGWLDAAGIRRELQNARCLVFPPLWFETFGLVVVEAAALGVPAIVADCSAATDHVRERVNGRRFAHGSAHSLARVMIELASDDAQVRRLGHTAYDSYWREPLTPQRHGDELLGIYREANAAPRAQSNGRRTHGRLDRFGAGGRRSVPVRGDAVPVPK